MTYDSNISPVGWYVGTYQLRFIELAHCDNNDPERKFLIWDNTVLVRATSLDEAYDKIERIANEDTEPYKGGAGDIDVQWVYEGIVNLLPVYEELEDGAEIMWAERTTKLKNLRMRALTKEQCYQRSPRAQQAAPGDAAEAAPLT